MGVNFMDFIEIVQPDQEQIKTDTTENNTVTLEHLKLLYEKFGNSKYNTVILNLEKRIETLEKKLEKEKDKQNILRNKFKNSKLNLQKLGSIISDLKQDVLNIIDKK